jgi:ubiquinone/menaquinone biosynthesis C-methylase UbiE
MDIYRNFARIYDPLMTDIPYRRWAGYLDTAFRTYGTCAPDGPVLLDLACGTGTLAIHMARKGYEIIGVDASEDMLSEAHAKAYDAGINMLLLAQDMRELDLYGTVDGAYCACDGLNYMLTEGDFLTVLKRVAMFLNPGGVFVFDVNTVHKFKNLLKQRAFSDTTKTASFFWKNSYNEDTSINEYRVRFFTSGPDGEDVSFEEVHKQRAYPIDVVAGLVSQAGLTIKAVNDDYTDGPPRDDSSRITFVAVKPI